MSDDYGLLENWDESGEGEPDTWWCDVCQEDVAMFIPIGEALPTHCPVCGTKFSAPENILLVYC